MKKQTIKKMTLDKKTVSILMTKATKQVKGGGGNEYCPTMTVCPEGCPTTFNTNNP